MVAGASQKNNRDPVIAMDEHAAFDALESLRAKGLAVRVDQAGSRVNRYRQAAMDVLHVRTAELAILAELLLRGPQTLGELRGRASRMQPLESLDLVKGMLTALVTRAEPLGARAPAVAGEPGRAVRTVVVPRSAPASGVGRRCRECLNACVRRRCGVVDSL